MKATFTCAEADAEGMSERYLAERLDGAELERFEEHLFECDRCIEELRLGAAVRNGLRPPSGRAVASAVHLPRRRRWWLPLVALAATVAGVLLLPGGDDDDFRRLGAVAQPPVYVGVAVRTAAARADSTFAAAMSAYTIGSYREAVDGLREALDAGIDPAPARFFLGASLLMLGEAEAAAREFADVIALGPSPYLPEAHYYRSKALLRLGRSDIAVEELRRAEASGSRIAGPAAALADSVRAAAGS